MPIYEYACSACGHQFEEWQKMSDPPVRTCPKCKKKKVERLISQTAFQLKGGGWYADLYSSSKPGKGSSSEGGGDKDSGSSKDGGSSKEASGKDGGTKAGGKDGGSSAKSDSGGKDSGSKDSGSKHSGSQKEAKTPAKKTDTRAA